ncbi:hypothetical protein NLU13_3661 [Sarocladium strictum]|uniref:Major facilitator superfamily (MFS) profile domain-containing protein n=1 Tax=Sarocladium strictum TaxID=5046 RepID=A0AA39GNV8_SARSR|nr:hypothetical protein NLU13_3661 [Sarocladium strictum]
MGGDAELPAGVRAAEIGTSTTTAALQPQDDEKGTARDCAEDVHVDTQQQSARDVEAAEAQDGRESWNSSPITTYRFLAVNWSFIVIGMNDACIGALLPYIEEYYGINYTTVSTLFIVFFPGALLAGMTNNYIHYRLGQRGVAILGPLCRIVGYIPLALHPRRSFAILPCLLIFTGFGNGIEDSGWNAYVGNMRNANELLGLLHGAYGLGATIAPLVATSLVTRAGLPWWTFFYLMLGLCVVQLAVLASAFWSSTGAAYRRKMNYYYYQDNSSSGGGAAGSASEAQEKKRITTRQVLRGPIPWVMAVFLFGYVGAEVSLGGWIVTFMLRVRDAAPFLAGLTVTLFWLGLTIGRVVLGFVTGRIGEKLAITVYLILAIVLEVLYWLVPNFVAAVVFVTLLGFFLGPLFPAAVVVATKLLPAEHHVSAIGFSTALGGGGAAVFPYAVGAIAQEHGVAVLQPFVLGILVFITVAWLVLPGGLRKGGLERAREAGSKPGEELVRGLKRVIRRRGTTS